MQSENQQFMNVMPFREPIPFLFTPPSPFAIPAGCYRAVLKGASMEEDDDGDPVLRMLYDIVRGESGSVKYAVVIEYPAGRAGHTKLNKDLEAFFQQDELDRLLGMPMQVDLKSFVGDEVDLMISMFTGNDHPTYSKVTGVYPAGSLIKGEILCSRHTSWIN